MEERESASALIAARMLQGWALMGEHCPVCVTPLMRSKEKRMFCVSCQQWVVREVENGSDEKVVAKVGNPSPEVGDGNSGAQTQTKGSFTSMRVRRTLEAKVMELCQGIEDTSDVVQLKLLLDTLASCLACLEKVSSPNAT